MPEQVRVQHPNADAPDPPVEPFWKELLGLLPIFGFFLAVMVLAGALAVTAGMGLDAL